MTIGLASVFVLGLVAAAPAGPPRCSTGEAAVAEIRSAHEAARRAHLEGRVELMVPGMAERMVVVSNGNVEVNPKDKTEAFFRAYFGRVQYLEWSDVEPPLIQVSPDGQMAWMAVKVRARYLDRTKPEGGEKAFRSSWIATYAREGCRWTMTGNASAVVSE